MQSPFIPDDEEYKRDIDILDGYVDDAAMYLRAHTGQDIEECKAFIKAKLTQQDSKLKLMNPKTLYLNRKDNGDREIAVSSFTEFMDRIKKENLIFSPAMNIQVQPEVRESSHAKFLAQGIKRRSAYKKQMFDARQKGEHERAKILDGMQKNAKINNNSYSGATVSVSTALHYKSTHPSLTSLCRTATSAANSANEKFLAGMRHWYTPEITKANIVNIVNNTDLELLGQVCLEFEIKFPTVNETMDCVRRSCSPYWRSKSAIHLITNLIGGFNEVERAAVVYVNDLYHLHKHNPQLVETFIKHLIHVVPEDSDKTISDEQYEAFDEDLQMLAMFQCFEEIGGEKITSLKEKFPLKWNQLKNTAQYIYDTLVKYQDMIKALWLTTNLPCSVYNFPSAMRKAVIISDTDSTMFTLQNWVENITGRAQLTNDAKRVSFAMTYLVSEIIMHMLAVQSANMGVGKDHLRLLAMKNEFYFPSMCMTTRSKHYFSMIGAQEGTVYEKEKLEVKGVGLRDSKVPAIINEKAKDMMVRLSDEVKSGNKINLVSYLTEVADLEREIIRSIDSGESVFTTRAQIKSPDSYKNAEVSNYIHYGLWNEVFADAYGPAPPPAYSVTKVSLRASNRTELNEWCDQMENQETAKKLKLWLAKSGRKDLNTLLIPDTVVETHGIPKDIVIAIDKRKIIANTTGVFYLMFESLGYFIQERKNVRLISDYY